MPPTAAKKWRERHWNSHLDYQQKRRHEVRIETLRILSGVDPPACKKCGYSRDWRALQVDHIEGNGKVDKSTKMLWGFRTWLKENLEEGRSRYQVLCANCNWIKRHTKQEFNRDRKPNKE